MGFFKRQKELLGELGELHQRSQAMPRPSMLDGVRQANDLIAQTDQWQRLMQVGVPGRAHIDASQDTGMTINEQAVADVAMTVTVAGRAPYQVHARLPVPRMLPGVFAPGQSIPVRVDPDDPHALMFDQTAYATQATTGTPQDGGIPVQDPTDRLARLADLRDRGVLTDGEFEAQKARILAEL